MSRDLLERPYGRFYFIPKQLSLLGNQIHICMIDYSFANDAFMADQDISYHSISIKNPIRCYTYINELILKEKFDWIFGFSDTFYGILAVHFANKHNINSLIDAYDNFESYIPWCKPLHVLWRKSLGSASLVTAAGPGLTDLLEECREGLACYTIPMSADPIFRQLDKQECRKTLNLPLNDKLIGYSGAIHPNRGITILFEAFEQVAKYHPACQLYLTGRKDDSITLPPKVKYLGDLSDEQVPLFHNSMDILTAINKSSAFGHHSYPVKLYEAMACNIPIIATQTLATEWILKDHSQFLCKADNSADLSDKLLTVLAQNIERYDYGELQSWDESARILNKLLLEYEAK